MKNKCFSSVNNFEELVKEGDLKICFLHDPECGYTDSAPKRPEGLTKNLINQKYKEYLSSNGLTSWDQSEVSSNDYLKTINGKYNYRSAEEANLFQNINRNLGIVFPSNPEPPFWVCVDVDGQDYEYMIKNNPELKTATRSYLSKCLVHGLRKRGIKFVCIKTANEGYHFYFKANEAHFSDHLLGSFSYPSQILIGKRDERILEKHPLISSIAEKPMAKKALKIFTNGKMVVAPGSVINNEKYIVTEEGIDDFKNVTVYKDGPVEDFIASILLEDCFFKTEDNKIEKQKFNLNISKNKSILSSTNIKNIGDSIIKTFRFISSQKNYAASALGGFLRSQNISSNSITDLGKYIMDNASYNLSNDFIAAFTHDSDENIEKQGEGLIILKDIFKEAGLPFWWLTKVLWKNISPSFHKFVPNNIGADIYEEITMDFTNKEMKMEKFKNITNKDGGKSKKLMNSLNIKHVITDMKYIDDIASEKILELEEKPICINIDSFSHPNHLYYYKNTADLIQNYNKIPSAHKIGKRMIEYIMDEYEDNRMIDEIETSSIPGIFLSRDKKRVRRFIRNEGNNQVVEIFPKRTDKEKLINALRLLKRINDAYPWSDDKFAVFVKLGMILPYSYIYKTTRRIFIRGIILSGEGGTLKSSASELIVRMNAPSHCVDVNRSNYIIAGPEFSTPFRIGQALHRHSYPIAIEEVESVFDKKENLEFIKNAIENPLIRNPNGDKKYYARATPIFSLNELDHKIEKSGIFKRFLILNFTKEERGDIPKIKKALSFLNVESDNSRFKELYPISEFIFYIISHHLEYLSLDPQELIDNVLWDMQKYTGLDLSWLTEIQFEEYYENDRREEGQNDLSTVLDVLKYPFNSSIKFGGVGSNTDEKLLETLIEEKYPYIYRIKSTQSNGVIITADFGKIYKKKFPSAKKISQNRLIELLKNHLDLKHDIYLRKLKPHNFKKRIKGVFIDWEDFCSIFNVKINNIEA